ncbi:MAG: flavodoxin [Clostridia bacterium]|nr:flavodoxin [Clostridia bacterium]
MKILVVIKSKHQGNTQKIAEAMAEVAPVTITMLEDVKNYKLSEYDIVGFGSGIYFGKHDKELLKFVEGVCDKKAYSFVFSTSGTKSFEKNNSALVKLLESKNKVVLGSFGCQGLDKFFIFKLGGGLNKNHPDMEDFEAAQQFILDVIKKYNKLTAQ